MPKRNDLKKILLLGSGPIVIGQACEFDYSGTQACKALKEEGFEIVLVNSNPATIMTDPSLADKTYVEPLDVETVEKVIAKEKPCAILPTLGGQTALNLAIDLAKEGVLEKYGVEMIGANQDVIERAEDRQLFKDIVENLGFSVPESKIAYSVEDAKKIAFEIGFPCVIRSAFTLGGSGGGIAYNVDEVEEIATLGIEKSRICEIIIEKSILGWKEFELELMRDKNDNVLIICSIENIDPMGVHTGDSITVAPIQTLSDVEYQELRDMSKDIIRAIGVETGGSNIQFAQNPDTGEVIVIEMNPRVSRSSALASKATGFPIAKLAAKLAVGYTLDELLNDITKSTPASFEPTLDYCAVKIPRFNFDKFPNTKPELGVSMKSVGEVMAIGRTFKEALQKATRSLELKRFGLFMDGCNHEETLSAEALDGLLSMPNPRRIFVLAEALRRGYSLDDVFEKTKINRWFLHQIQELILASKSFSLTKEKLLLAKQMGFSDKQLSIILGVSELEIFNFRKEQSIMPTYKVVDTCSGEFEAKTPYYYATYEEEDEIRKFEKERILIVGSGPNRIGQGIEFDYCCVHASYACQELGYESVMINSNPETVSTDFDTSDQLFFEPLSLEDVLQLYHRIKPKGVIIQFGGQTPLNLAAHFAKHGISILGTSWESIDLAENREAFNNFLDELEIKKPANGMAENEAQALAIANQIGYPVLLRPSYVLGGANMEIVYDDTDLKNYIHQAKAVSPEHPVLIDSYLEQAIEIDVDALCDAESCVIAGVMEHIERAGIHSGDSTSVLPAHTLTEAQYRDIVAATKKIGVALKVKGLLNIQFAIKADEVFVLEVNPRASRTVPFISKATGIHWAKLATRVILGESIQSLGVKDFEFQGFYAVKEVVFPFRRFPLEDIVLGPQMKSTGEVMGIDTHLGAAFVKAQQAAGYHLPKSGCVFLSLRDEDKQAIKPIVEELDHLGFNFVATRGTAALLEGWGYAVKPINKVIEGRPHIVDALKNKDVDLVINTPSGKYPMEDEKIIRQVASDLNIPLFTTVEGASSVVAAIPFLREGICVKALQDYTKDQQLVR